MLRLLYIFCYILLNAYIIWRTLRWMRHCYGRLGSWKFRIGYIIIFSGLAAVVITSHFLQDSGMFRGLQRFSSSWFGVLFYIIFYVFVTDVIRFLIKFFRLTPKGFFARPKIVIPGGLAVIALIAGTSIYGFVHVKDMKTVYYEVNVDKACGELDEMRIVLVSDQHLGYTIGAKDMEKMVEKINAADPDLVCIAGDIFDNNYDSLDDAKGIEEALKRIESEYGVYACWGNHDVTEPLFSGFSVDKRSEALRDRRMDKLLEDAGIIVLNDQAELVADSFYVAGRLDYEKAGDGTNNRKSIGELMDGVDTSKPVILLDHEPRELDEIAAAGVDIDLSGHTHKGQIFPMNLTGGLFWENNYGILQKGQMYSIVTSGIGVYGPAMRVFTDSEVAVVDVSFIK